MNQDILLTSWKSVSSLLLGCGLTLLAPLTSQAEESPSHKAGYKSNSAFGGPTAPEIQLESDDRLIDPAVRFPYFDEMLEPWFDWKENINEKYDLKLGGYYMNVYQNANESMTGFDDAFGGKLRLTSVWTPYRTPSGNYGRLAFTLDYRHKYSDIASTDLSAQIGYLGLTQVVLTDGGLSVIHLNWAQAFRGGDAGFIIGRIDPNDYMDVLGYSSPWTGFATSTIQLNASQSFQESAWGFLAGNWFNDNWYALAVISDANGYAEDDLSFFSGGAEFFKQVEVGWAPSKAERLNRKISLSAWQKDARSDLGKGSGEGFMFSAGWTFDNWTTFFRAGISSGSAPSFNRILSTGFLKGWDHNPDQLGIGINWGDPSNSSLPEQTTAEIFYRYHLSQNFAITPSIQWVHNPALNEQDDEVFVFGLRSRLTF